MLPPDPPHSKRLGQQVNAPFRTTSAPPSEQAQFHHQQVAWRSQVQMHMQMPSGPGVGVGGGGGGGVAIKGGPQQGGQGQQQPQQGGSQQQQVQSSTTPFSGTVAENSPEYFRLESKIHRSSTSTREFCEIFFVLNKAHSERFIFVRHRGGGE